MSVIQEHADFADILTTPGVKDGKSAGFDPDMYKSNMESNSPIYESSNSFFVLDVMNGANKAIPVMQSRLTWIKDHHFKNGIPSRFPFPLVGVVASGLDVKANHGKIQILSPPEFVWAPISG